MPLHLIGPVGQGFRLRTATCPVLMGDVVRQIVRDFEATRAFPGVPVSGRSLDDLDPLVFDALLVVAEEARLIDLAKRAEVGRG